MKAKPTYWLAVCALIAYSAILIRLVVFKAIPTVHVGHLIFRLGGTRSGHPNLVPFKTIAPLLLGRGHRLIAMANLLGNIVPFMPIGFLAPLVFRSFSWQKALLLGIATGLTFELTELVFRVGIFDVDDIILNAVGVLLGYAAFAMVQRRTQPRSA